MGWRGINDKAGAANTRTFTSAACKRLFYDLHASSTVVQCAVGSQVLLCFRQSTEYKTQGSGQILASTTAEDDFAARMLLNFLLCGNWMTLGRFWIQFSVLFIIMDKNICNASLSPVKHCSTGSSWGLLLSLVPSRYCLIVSDWWSRWTELSDRLTMTSIRLWWMFFFCWRLACIRVCTIRAME